MIDQDKTKPPKPEREPSQEEVAAMIADQLGEAEEWPRRNILIIVRALGRTQSRQLLEQTLQIEASGGMMLPDNSRRRTPGGVFFHLAYTTGQPKPGKKLTRPMRRQMPKPKEEKPSVQATPKEKQPVSQPAPVFTWNDRISLVKVAEKEKGNATTVKITLIGRPGNILDKGQFIVTVMESTKIPALPKGLPTPTNVATKYAVYIAAKQWKKVAESIQDPEDILIVEGFPKTDPEVKAIAVFATNVTTKKLQAAQRQGQQKN
jgi:hypothetical protein